MLRFGVIFAIVLFFNLSACEYRYEKRGTTNEVPPSTEGTLSDIHFNVVESHVLEPKCAICHNPNTDFDICSYNVAFALKDTILQRINSTGRGQMPPPGAPALTPEEKSLLIQWIRAGAPE